MKNPRQPEEWKGRSQTRWRRPNPKGKKNIFKKKTSCCHVNEKNLKKRDPVSTEEQKRRTL